jgi:hypothetical protein
MPEAPVEETVKPAPRDSTAAKAARRGGAPLAPRWGHVPSGSFDAITRAPDGVELPVPVESKVEENDANPRTRAKSYTWLQMVALALVAFVLGFLVWLLIKGPTQPGATGASAPVPTTSSSGPSSPHLGEL